MKKLLVIALVGMLPMLMSAQNKCIKDFYKKYKSEENVTSIKLSGFLLKMVARFSDEDDEDKEIMSKITKLRILDMDDKNVVSPKDYKKFLKDIKKDNFTELIKVTDGGEKVDILLQEKGDKIKGLLILVSDKKSFTMVSLEGNFSWEDLKNLDMDIEGAEHLDKVPQA